MIPDGVRRAEGERLGGRNREERWNRWRKRMRGREYIEEPRPEDISRLVKGKPTPSNVLIKATQIASALLLAYLLTWLPGNSIFAWPKCGQSKAPSSASILFAPAIVRSIHTLRQFLRWRHNRDDAIGLHPGFHGQVLRSDSERLDWKKMGLAYIPLQFPRIRFPASNTRNSFDEQWIPCFTVDCLLDLLFTKYLCTAVT